MNPDSEIKSSVVPLKASNGAAAHSVSGRKACYAELQKLFEKYRGGNHLVILQGAPDPDAISCALALEFLGARFEIETTILAFQLPSHHENRALVKRLGINIVYWEEGFDVNQYSIYSIVDSKRFTTKLDKRLEEGGVQFLAFIDHHREDATAPNAQLIDIRPQYGSTAAILCEYLSDAFPKGLESTDPDHVRLATALMHGLRSDTSTFLRSTPMDYEAAAFLAPSVDHRTLKMIERKVLTSGVLGMFENALVRKRVHDNFIFSDVGYVRGADRDGIPQAAELLLAREGTDTVLVFGIVDEKTIDGSFRTTSETINPDEFLKGFLGVSPESGEYYGGGNIRDKGGFQIPLGFLGLFEDKNQVYSMAKETIEKSFLAYIGKAINDEEN
ncbi:MAG: DHH family phosphoesterase [Bdellovibrionales bacterium]|nr:DHH family phosphoesterase [Bdellovibrionales bacterium]